MKFHTIQDTFCHFFAYSIFEESLSESHFLLNFGERTAGMWFMTEFHSVVLQCFHFMQVFCGELSVLKFETIIG